MVREMLQASLNKLHKWLSLSFCFFCFMAVIIGISNDWNILDLDGPFIEMPLFFLSALVLFLNEGYQTGLLGVRYFNLEQMSPYPTAKRVRSLIFSSSYDRLPRLFLGQSFMVVLTTFFISMTTTFIYWPKGYRGLPEWFINIFLRSGLPGIVTTVNVFQLLPSIYAQRYPRQFLNEVPVLYYSVAASLFIESLGVLHCTFLLVDILEKILPTQAAWERGGGEFGSFPSKFSSLSSTGDVHTLEEIPNNKVSARAEIDLVIKSGGGSGEPRSDDSVESSLNIATDDLEVGSGLNNAHSNSPDGNGLAAPEDNEQAGPVRPQRFIIKVIISTAIFFASGIYIMVSLFTHMSLLDLTPFVLLLILLTLYVIVFYCEGLKIALVGTANFSTTELEARGYPTTLHDILIADSGSTAVGIPNFLLGRQMMVVPAGFLIANILAFEGYVNTFPGALYDLLVGFSLPNVLFTMQLVQLAPQVFAGRHTECFLRMPGATWIVRIALYINKLGLTIPADVIALNIASCINSRNNIMRHPSLRRGAKIHQSHKISSRGTDIPLGLNRSESGGSRSTGESPSLGGLHEISVQDDDDELKEELSALQAAMASADLNEEEEEEKQEEEEEEMNSWVNVQASEGDVTTVRFNDN